MGKFKRVVNDSYLKNHYQKISELEDQTAGWAYHGWQHVNNVAILAEQIMEALNYPANLIEETKIAALLHDAGALRGKAGHAERGAIFAKDYLKQAEINLLNQEQLLQAIQQHSDGFTTQNDLAVILMVADKLDITKSRVAKAGYQVTGMRQLQYIQGIDVNISNQKGEIIFQCEPQIDIVELNQFYFMEKVGKSIWGLASYFDIDITVILNNQKWSLMEKLR